MSMLITKRTASYGKATSNRNLHCLREQAADELALLYRVNSLTLTPIIFCSFPRPVHVKHKFILVQVNILPFYFASDQQ